MKKLHPKKKQQKNPPNNPLPTDLCDTHENKELLAFQLATFIAVFCHSSFSHFFFYCHNCYLEQKTLLFHHLHFTVKPNLPVLPYIFALLWNVVLNVGYELN